MGGPHMRWAKVAQEGGCNFCPERTELDVLVIRGNQFEVRACRMCVHLLRTCMPRAPRRSRRRG